MLLFDTFNNVIGLATLTEKHCILCMPCAKVKLAIVVQKLLLKICILLLVVSFFVRIVFRGNKSQTFDPIRDLCIHSGLLLKSHYRGFHHNSNYLIIVQQIK